MIFSSQIGEISLYRTAYDTKTFMYYDHLYPQYFDKYCFITPINEMYYWSSDNPQHQLYKQIGIIWTINFILIIVIYWLSLAKNKRPTLTFLFICIQMLTGNSIKTIPRNQIERILISTFAISSTFSLLIFSVDIYQKCMFMNYEKPISTLAEIQLLVNRILIPAELLQFLDYKSIIYG